jgi:hypothetical protein
MRRGRSYSEKVLLEGENFDHTIKLSKNISSSNNAELASFGIMRNCSME